MRILLFLFCLCTQLVFGQSKEVDASQPRLQYTAAYFHSGTINPGLQISADWVFKEYQKKPKVKKSGLSSRRNKQQLGLEARLGFYWDPLTHFSLFNQYLFSYRYVFQKSSASRAWILAASIGPGYHRSFFEETYEVDENNQVIELGWAGRGFFSSTFDFRFIRERKNKRLNAWIIGLNTILLWDYNATAAPIRNLFFGFRFNLKSQQ